MKDCNAVTGLWLLVYMLDMLLVSRFGLGVVLHKSLLFSTSTML